MQNVDDYAQIASIKVKDLRLVGVYRKPARDYQMDNRVTNYIQSTFVEDNIVMSGDFNLPGCNWITSEYTTRSEKSWLDLKEEMTLHQHVQGPTQTAGNCLDLIFSRSSNSLSIADIVIEPYAMYSVLSDHNCIQFSANVLFCKNVKKTVIIDTKNADWDKYKCAMRNENLIPRTERSENSVLKWQLIEDSIILARDSACQKKEVIQGKTPRWMSKGLQTALRKDQKLRQIAKKQARSSVKRDRNNKWRAHHRNVKHWVQKARVEFESSKILNYDKDPKMLFKTIKKAKTINNASPPINDQNGQSLESDQEKADAFQRKFVQIYTENDQRKMTWPDIPGGLNHVNFTTVKIKQAIKSLKTDSAPGSDGLGPIYYKNGDLSLVFALSDLYQHAFDNCDLPLKFLVSKVIAIWKGKGLISDIDTYRCITLMCIAFKIMEKIIVWDIDSYLHTNGLYDEWQHGFQRQKSTVTNLVDTWEFISKKVDNGENWITLSVDLSAAFDKLSISHLMEALQEKGIGGRLGRFLEYWLNSRKQYVQVGNAKSEAEICSSGVPQGSCGGPAYFSILISSVYKNLEAAGAELGLKFWAFADDTRLAFKAETEAEFDHAQVFINNFTNGLKRVGLRLNPSKSIMVYYGNQKLRRHLEVDGINIPIEKSSLELGCVFTNNMSFKPCIDRNISKAKAFIFMIRNTVCVRNYSVLKKLYNVYLIPIVLYSCQVWHSSFEYVKSELYSIWRKFWRLGKGIVKPGPEISDPFQHSMKSVLMFLFKMRVNKTCLNYSSFFESAPRSNTRSDNPNNLKINANRLVTRDGFFTTLAAKWHNDLPENLKIETSEPLYKRGISDYVRSKEPTPPFDFRPWYRK